MELEALEPCTLPDGYSIPARGEEIWKVNRKPTAGMMNKVLDLMLLPKVHPLRVKGGRAMGRHKINAEHREQFANQIKARSKRGSITKSMREKGVAAVGQQRWRLAEDIFSRFIGDV